MAKVTERDGKLAVEIGWSNDRDNPISRNTVYIGKAPIAMYIHLKDLPIKFRGNAGTVYHNGRYYHFVLDNSDEWERVEETRPIKKPRRGKDYDWEWSTGQWRKT